MFGGIRFRINQIFGLIALAVPHKRNNHFDVIVVRVDAIGDYILWRDSLDAYREMLNGKRSLLICADVVRPLAESEELFTDIWSFNRRNFELNFSYFRKQFRYLQTLSADTVINPNWERLRMGDIMVKAIRSSSKVGMAGKGKRYFETRFYDHQYKTLIPRPNTVSEIEAIQYFTQRVISPTYQYGKRQLIAFDYVPPTSDPFVVFALSASDDRKVWDPRQFAKVIDSIPSSFKIVLSGAGIGDDERAAIVTQSVKDRKRIINLVNKTSLKELVSLIATASFVVGNDSAAVHIAAATRVPSVCVTTGAHFLRFIPYPPGTLIGNKYLPHAVYNKMDCFGCGYNCTHPINERYECLRRVSTDVVIREVERLLS